MKKQIFVVLFLLISSLSFSQQNPYHLEDLPSSTKFEFVGEVDLHVSNNKSEMYFANVDKNTSFSYIITQNLPDCLVTSNQFNGVDVYKKLIKGGYQRIIHIRKAGEIFKVHYVGENNENEKLILSANVSDGHSAITTLKIAYTFYWNDTLKN